MGNSELHNLQNSPSSEEWIYAVYFSHGDKFEVIATSEEEAKTAAKALYFEWGGYCTRAVRLHSTENAKTQNSQSEEEINFFNLNHNDLSLLKC